MSLSKFNPLVSQRPLIGVADESSFLVYSLRTHTHVKSLSIAGFLESLSFKDRFIVMCTTNPPSLRLSLITSITLHFTPSALLASFAHPAPLQQNTSNLSVSDINALTTHAHPNSPLPYRLPMFASSPATFGLVPQQHVHELPPLASPKLTLRMPL